MSELKRTTSSMECWSCKATHVITRSAPAARHWRVASDPISYTHWTFPCCRCDAELIVLQTNEEAAPPSVYMNAGGSTVAAKVVPA